MIYFFLQIADSLLDTLLTLTLSEQLTCILETHGGFLLDFFHLSTWEGTLFGGSIRIDGSHSPGGSTVTWSKNSSIPDNKSFLSLAL